MNKFPLLKKRAIVSAQTKIFSYLLPAFFFAGYSAFAKGEAYRCNAQGIVQSCSLSGGYERCYPQTFRYIGLGASRSDASSEAVKACTDQMIRMTIISNMGSGTYYKSSQSCAVISCKDPVKQQPTPVDVRPELTPAPAEQPFKTALSLGRGPGGGIVFFVDSSGSHGLEAKAADEANGLEWDAAITAASAYGSGWHLPTKDELNRLYQQKDVVGGFASFIYWSSTPENASNDAWCQDFRDGDDGALHKSLGFGVRAVRAF